MEGVRGGWDRGREGSLTFFEILMKLSGTVMNYRTCCPDISEFHRRFRHISPTNNKTNNRSQ